MPDVEDIKDAIDDFICAHQATFGIVSLFYILMDMFFPGWDDFLDPEDWDFEEPPIEVN
ncbi:hypothetical protein BJY04DRAFT_214632 [Aspergillus karnatakaensis]|uniref:uncharacterized protein n=1 Tax=Aspergillus karnatakaensis TaxID=1810916 RepID=UPI003CCC9204